MYHVLLMLCDCDLIVKRCNAMSMCPCCVQETLLNFCPFRSFERNHVHTCNERSSQTFTTHTMTHTSTHMHTHTTRKTRITFNHCFIRQRKQPGDRFRIDQPNTCSSSGHTGGTRGNEAAASPARANQTRLCENNVIRTY